MRELPAIGPAALFVVPVAFINRRRNEKLLDAFGSFCEHDLLSKIPALQLQYQFRQHLEKIASLFVVRADHDDNVNWFFVERLKINSLVRAPDGDHEILNRRNLYVWKGDLNSHPG